LAGGVVTGDGSSSVSACTGGGVAGIGSKTGSTTGCKICGGPAGTDPRSAVEGRGASGAAGRERANSAAATTAVTVNNRTPAMVVGLETHARLAICAGG
jgi:hypothetical protein